MLCDIGARQSRVGCREIRTQAYRLSQLRNRFIRLPFLEKGDSILSVKQVSMGALQPSHAADHDQTPGEQNRDPAQKVVMLRSELGDERAQKQPHEQAADVR